MITRTLHGVPFHVISPSFYELASHPEIDVSYVGDCWFLHVPREDGSPAMQPFKSLDEAACFVALGMLGAKPMQSDPQSYRLTPAHKFEGWWVCPCGCYNSPDDNKCWSCDEEPDE